MTGTARPEVGASIVAGGIATNYLEHGAGNPGTPVVFVHGSGPGVTAYANWRLVLPALGSTMRVLAPDMVGFGYSERPDGVTYGLQTWADQVLGFLDAMGLERVSLVGNSFGGAIALRLVTQHPDRVSRLVLMGSIGVSFPITEALETVWGYQPSQRNMRRVLDAFAYSRDLVDDELAEVRYRASIEPGFQESFSAMFPPPRQHWVEAMTIPDAELAAIDKETLIVHGREDQVIPLSTSLRLLELIVPSQLHVFGRCGHWSQIEWNEAFNELLRQFLSTKDTR